MNLNQSITTVIVGAFIIYAIYRQVREKKVKGRALLIWPILSIYEAYTILPKQSIPNSQIIECLLIVLVGVAAGAIQSLCISVYYKGNQLYMRGSIKSLLTWVGLIVCRSIIRHLFNVGSFYASFGSTGWIFFIGIAFTFGSKTIFLALRYPEIRETMKTKRTRRHRFREQ